MPPSCRFPARDRRWTIGRRTRSENDRCISISSSDLGWTTSCERRACTASSAGRAATPKVMRSTAPAARTAMRISGDISLHLDIDDATNEHESEAHAEQPDQEENDSHRQAKHL